MIAAVPARLFLSASNRRIGARAIAALLLIAITCVPSLARVHDRLDHQRTPAQEHSRFRWSNSCASVPQKATTVVIATPADGPSQTLVEFPLRLSRPTAVEDVSLPESSSSRSPH